MPTRRRDLLIVLSAVGAAVALPTLLRRWNRSPGIANAEFSPIPGLPGFRQLTSGPVSGGPGGDFLLTGLQSTPPAQQALRRQIAAAPCRAAFGPAGWSEGTVPVAVFTDYNCPYCPTLSELVIEEIDIGAPIAVTWHDFPILGPRSEAAARVAIAAGHQSQYLPVHQHLMHNNLRPGPAALRQLATEFELDPDRLLHNAASQTTSDRLAHTAATAAVFGIIGTPSLLVGRTLVVGNTSRETLRALIEMELSEPLRDCPG